MNRAIRNRQSKRCAFRKRGGGFEYAKPLFDIPADDATFAVKAPVHGYTDDCAFPVRPWQQLPQPDLSLAQTPMAGGAYAIDSSTSVGGTGPNVAPVVSAIPCPNYQGTLIPDPRAPPHFFSASPGEAQSGGGAPGSEIPVYDASVAGFAFKPASEAGAALPDGATDYMEVVPQAARTGGALKKRKTYRKRRAITRRRRSNKRLSRR